MDNYTNIKPYSILVCVSVNASFIGHSLKHFSRISDNFIHRKIQMIGYLKSIECNLIKISSFTLLYLIREREGSNFKKID